MNQIHCIAKPPLGILPKDVFFRDIKIERFEQIKRTISNYMISNMVVKIEWIEEYNELLGELRNYLL
jgi:hypothetical protein